MAQEVGGGAVGRRGPSTGANRQYYTHGFAQRVTGNCKDAQALCGARLLGSRERPVNGGRCVNNYIYVYLHIPVLLALFSGLKLGPENMLKAMNNRCSPTVAAIP